MLESRNKSLMFVITSSLSLTLFLLLPLVFLLISIACAYAFTFIALAILLGFPLSIKKAIGHLNSYIEEYKGEVLELLIGNPASFLDLS